MNRVRLPKKNKCRRRSDLHGHGIWHNMLVRGKRFERKEAFAARENHGPENENESEGQRLYEKGLELIKNLNWSAARLQKRRF